MGTRRWHRISRGFGKAPRMVLAATRDEAIAWLMTTVVLRKLAHA